MISENNNLESVLYVPNLNCNLLSVSKFTKERNCITKFSSNLCEFQELGLEKIIGSARLCARLYLLLVEDASKPQPSQRPCMALNSSINSDSLVMLWHYRLGHPTFMYLKKLFPSLFNEKAKTFQCEIC